MGKRIFELEIYAIGGLELTIPVQATVMMFFSAPWPQDTITAGTGFNMAAGFSFLLGIFIPLSVYSKYLQNTVAADKKTPYTLPKRDERTRALLHEASALQH